MNIPLHWAKATAQDSDPTGLGASFSCWRSSNVSSEDARQSAPAAAKRIHQRFLGSSLDRYPYGCGNVPLREEVIQRFEDSQGELYAAVTISIRNMPLSRHTWLNLRSPRNRNLIEVHDEITRCHDPMDLA